MEMRAIVSGYRRFDIHIIYILYMVYYRHKAVQYNTMLNMMPHNLTTWASYGTLALSMDPFYW